MAQIDYEQAVQALRSHLGTRYEGMEVDGRSEMADVLKNELGYSAHEADEAIDAMINSGALHYRRATNENDRNDETGQPAFGVLPVVPGVTDTGTASYSGAPVVPLPIGGCYWQIGEGDEAEGGRKGQVEPL